MITYVYFKGPFSSWFTKLDPEDITLTENAKNLTGLRFFSYDKMHPSFHRPHAC